MKVIGYQKLIELFGLSVREPVRISWVRPKGSERTSKHEDGQEVEIYPPRYDPGEGWPAHLGFALKHEGINLEILAALLAKAPVRELTAWVKGAPTSRYCRIAWFLYEWTSGKTLPIADLRQGNYLPVLDEKAYYCPEREEGLAKIRRQRLVNNLPGTPAYCPMVRRTALLRKFEAKRLDGKAKAAISKYPREALQRAMRFLFVKETKSSFAIEKLEPDQKRTARFVGLLEQAGRLDCYSPKELIRLQNAIVETRYAARGFRDFQNYIGETLGPTREIVHYIPPKVEDLQMLMEGWEACCRRLEAGRIHPVVTAAIAGYGFVFLHPFEDGNGRLHRFLIQHALSAGGFAPQGILFPVSATMLKHPAKYDASLEAYSRPMMGLLEYELDEQGAIMVSGNSNQKYRYPDLTAQAEALFGFIETTIGQEMVAELDFLTVFDEAKNRIKDIVDMPDRRLDFFLRLCLQGKGRISKAKRIQFRELSDAEMKRMESIVLAAIRKTGSA